MKKTPFYELHLELGAKMVPFAGFQMPIQYEGIIPEHLQVRSSAGLFDVSHMGEIIVRGPQALEFLSYVTTNNPAKLSQWQVQYSAFGNQRGGAVDDLLVYRLPDYWLLVVNAANTEKDWNHLNSVAKDFDVELENASDRVAQLALQGPKAQEVLQSLTDFDLEKIEYYWAQRINLMGKEGVLVSRTGYTGEDGFEIYCQDFDFMVDLARKLLADPRVKPAGLGARDTLRLEAGYCLYGNDIDDDTNLLEAGLGWIIDFEKPDFIGKKALLESKERGLKRRRVGFVLTERGVPRHGNKVFRDGEEAGWVSSGTYLPSLKVGGGMAYVPRDLKVGHEFEVEVRPGKRLGAKRVKLPMVQGSVRR